MVAAATISSSPTRTVSTSPGGPGDDEFRFKARFGHDVITDFTQGEDMIVISHKTFANLHAVKTHSHVVDGHVVIEVNASETIALNTVHHVHDLTVDDFSFC